MSTLRFKLTNLFILSILAAFFTIWWWLAKDIASVPTYLTSFEGYHESKDDLEVITIGNSHAAAIDFDALSLGEGRHFFVPATGVNAAITSINVLQKDLPSLKYVMWPISRGTLERDIRDIPRVKRKFTANLVSNLPASFEVTKNYIIGTFDFYFTGQLARLSSLRWKVDEYIKNHYGLATLKKRYSQKENKNSYTHGLHDNAFTKSASSEQLKIDANLAADKLHIDTAHLADPIKTAEYNLKLLTENLKRLALLDINIILFEAPLTPYLREHLEKYKELDELENTAKHYSNIHFFRYADWLDSSLKNGNIYFHDSSHLNRVGAKHFSRHIRKEILKAELSVN